MNTDKIEIVPAILPKDYYDLKEKLMLIKDAVTSVQLDVCDGTFTPNLTWPYNVKDESVELLTEEKEELPYWQTIQYEVDIFSKEVGNKCNEWLNAGAQGIVLHLKAIENFGEVVKKYRNKINIAMGIEVGTDISEYDEYIPYVKSVEMMGIRNIGFQGQKMDELVFDEIKELRKKYPKLPITIDGGIRAENVGKARDSGVNRIIIGSAIWMSDEPLKSLMEFRRKVL